MKMLVGKNGEGILGLHFGEGMKRNGEVLLMYSVCFGFRAKLDNDMVIES